MLSKINLARTSSSRTDKNLKASLGDLRPSSAPAGESNSNTVTSAAQASTSSTCTAAGSSSSSTAGPSTSAAPSTSAGEPGPSTFRNFIKRLESKSERAPKVSVAQPSVDQPSSTTPTAPTGRSTSSSRRRRRSLHLPESFSDSETDCSLLRTSSFCDKNSKKWSLPVPSTWSRASEGSESTTTSFSSKSSGGESDVVVITPAGEDADQTFLASSCRGDSGASSAGKRARSKAAQTHTFSKIKSYAFERCKTCDTYVYLRGFKCEKCNLYSHTKCLKRLVIICHQRPLPRKPAKVFGAPLDSVSEEVPYIVVKCCLEIERRGYCIKGIYRVNGMKSRVEKLVRMLEYGPFLIDISDAHPNDLSNVLKQYFRELPEPIFTRELYVNFITIGKSYHTLTQDEREQSKVLIIDEITEVVSKLPEKHRATLAFLMHHLKFIADNAEINQMTAKNLGLVFAPTLFRMKDPDGKHFKMLFDNAFQALIIELLICYCYELFGPPPKVELFNFG